MDKNLQIKMYTILVIKTSRVEKFLIAIILLYAGIAFTLPVPYNQDLFAIYPWWAKKISFGNVLLYELLFIFWIALFGGKYVYRVLLNAESPVRNSAVWLMLFAIWVGIISLSSPLVIQDIGRTLRLLLNVALLLAAARWAQLGGASPMLWLIYGFLIGTSINLLISFQSPLIIAGNMRLSGQNTPGVAMGIAIHLSVWVFLIASKQITKFLMLIASLIFLFGTAISYSRIGWSAAAFGCMAWLYVLLKANPRYLDQTIPLRKSRKYLLPLVGMGLIVLFIILDGHEIIKWISALADQKLGPDSQSKEGDAHRWAYVIGTLEILSQRPWGVGYSGFYDAMTITEIYRSGVASPELDYEANPHAAFLWFATAGGVPGFFLGVTVFLYLLNNMRVGLSSAIGRPGMILFCLIIFPYLVIGMTVTYLLNSVILLVPAALAAGWGWAQRDKLKSTNLNMLKLNYGN